ncbi:MAG: hypothetical protein RSE41_08440 [Clostridia bacterium]
MNNKIVTIPKEYKSKIDIIIMEKKIPLPTYIKNSITKHRFFLDNDDIYLQRKCNECGEFFTVQIFDDNTFSNIEELPIRYIGKKSGFHNTCINCEVFFGNTNKSPIKPNVINSLQVNKLNQIQLNIDIDKDLKNYYKILAINNATNLKIEIINALLYYKTHRDNPSKN